MPTLESQLTTGHDANNIRKALKGAFFLRRRQEGQTLPDKLSGPDKQPIDLVGEGFTCLGAVSTDGYAITRGRESEGVQGHGYAGDLRKDVTGAPKSITMTALEGDTRITWELIAGMDLSGVTADENGEIVFDEGGLPEDVEYDGVLVTLDKQKASGLDYYQGAGFFRLSLSGDIEQTFNREGARQTPLTFDILEDTEVGATIRNYLFGEGLRVTEQGFQAAAGA